MALNNTVLLRAKSGPSVGLGHVMRSRSVAQEVLVRGGVPILIVDDAASARHLAAEPFRVVSAGDFPDWATTPAAGAWVDGFVEWKSTIEQLQALHTPVFLVENRSAARDQCDSLVYPALHWTPDAWDLENAERVLSGAPWIPLARDVRETRASETRDVDLLITFGGSDPAELTERVLSSLNPKALRVAVVVGPHMAARRDALLCLTEDFDGIEVLQPGQALAPLIARSRMAITALGTTLYELAYLGVPALILANYASDREALDWYASHGPHLPLGIAGALSCEGLRSSLANGLLELEAQGPCRVPELGSGAARLAEGLLRGAA
jgi:UDP-2,4-diacetamido-2,4,6-trideoxy-beta-L-altropyranose hydrolase